MVAKPLAAAVLQHLEVGQHRRRVAQVEVGLRKRQNLSMRNGFPAYYISIIPSYDANTVEMLDALNATVDDRRFTAPESLAATV